MLNPFKTGDKVITHLRGGEAEGVVRTTWAHEVQIRVPVEGLIWRTMKKVRLIQGSKTEEQPSEGFAESAGGPPAELPTIEPPVAVQGVIPAAGIQDASQNSQEDQVIAETAHVSSRRSKRDRKQSRKHR